MAKLIIVATNGNLRLVSGNQWQSKGKPLTFVEMTELVSGNQ